MAFDYLNDKTLPEDFFSSVPKKRREKYQLEFVRKRPSLFAFLKEHRLNYHDIDWKAAYYEAETGNTVNEISLSSKVGYLPVASSIYYRGTLRLDELESSQLKKNDENARHLYHSAYTFLSGKPGRLFTDTAFTFKDKDTNNTTVILKSKVLSHLPHLTKRLESSNPEDFRRFLEHYLGSRVPREEREAFVERISDIIYNRHKPVISNEMHPLPKADPATHEAWIRNHEERSVVKAPPSWVEKNFKGFFASEKDVADSAKNFIAEFNKTESIKKEQDKLRWAHPIESKIAAGVFEYKVRPGVVTQEKLNGHNFYMNHTQDGNFSYLGITEAVNYYYNQDYSNVSSTRAMERGTRIHAYVEEAIRDKSFKASLSFKDWEVAAGFKISKTGIKKQQEDMDYIAAHVSRMTSEMTYANRVLSYIKNNFPSAQGWKIQSEYVVSDYMNYASSIDILCTNSRTKEAVILDLKTGTVHRSLVNAQTGIYKLFLQNESRFKDYSFRLGAISIDKATHKLNMIPLEGITEDQAHEILYPNASFGKKSIWYNKQNVGQFNPGAGIPHKDTKVIYEEFAPNKMFVSPLDHRVVSDIFHKSTDKGFGEIVSFDIETVPLSNGTMSLRSYSIFNMSAHRAGGKIKLKYDGTLDDKGNLVATTLDERAFLSKEAFGSADSISQKAQDALEKNLLSDSAVKAFEAAHGREATIATSDDILKIMDKLVGKTVVGQNILSFDFPQLLAMGKRLAKAEGGDSKYSTFKAAFENKLSQMSIIDTYELAKELRHKAPKFFDTITVEALLSKLSPKDAARLKPLLHQSSADVVATAKIFEILLNGLPSQEKDFLFKIVKDTTKNSIGPEEKRRFYTLTSHYETDTKRSEARIDEGPIGFDLHKTTHWILGDEKMLGDEHFVRFDDARKYERGYQDTVRDAIAKNQVTLIPMPNGKGYYLSIPEEEEQATTWENFEAYTNSERRLKKILKQHGRMVIDYEDLAKYGLDFKFEGEKNVLPLYRRVIRKDDNVLKGYNRAPVPLRQKLFNTYYSWVSKLGFYKGTFQVKFEDLVKAYEKNNYLQNLDSIILSDKGTVKSMAEELIGLAEENEKLKDETKALKDALGNTSKAVSGIVEAFTAFSGGVDVLNRIQGLDRSMLMLLKESPKHRKVLTESIPGAGIDKLVLRAINATLDTKGSFNTDDLMYQFDILSGVPKSLKESLRPSFYRSVLDNPKVASSALSYIKSVKNIASKNGFSDSVTGNILTEDLTEAFKNSKILTEKKLMDVVPRGVELLKQEVADNSFKELQNKFMESINKNYEFNKFKYALSNGDTSILSKFDAPASEIPFGWSIKAANKRRAKEEAREKARIDSIYAESREQQKRIDEDYARVKAEERQRELIGQESADRRYLSSKYADTHLMIGGDLGQMMEATNAFNHTSKEYSRVMAEARDNTEKMYRFLGATIGTLGHTPYYNPENLLSAGYHQVGNIHHSLRGLLPNWMNTGITKFMTGSIQDYEYKWQPYRAAIRSLQPVGSMIGATLGALAGAPFGVGVQGAAFGGMAANGLMAWASQLYGNQAESRINQMGLFFSSRFNKMGALFAAGTGALDMFVKALRLAVKPLLITGSLVASGLGMGLYKYKRALATMPTLDTPLTNLTGIGYGTGYNGLAISDFSYGMKRGTTNSVIESIEFAKQGLLTLGKYDSQKLLSSAMLGIFNEAFMNPGNSLDNYKNMSQKIYDKYQASTNKGRFMYLLNEFNPEMARQLQIRTDYETWLNDPKSRGAAYRNRQAYYDPISGNERAEFRAISFFQSTFAESIQNSLMKIAAALYNWKGFDFMNKYTGYIGAAAGKFSEGDIQGGIKIVWDGIKEFVKSLRKLWDEVTAGLDIKGFGDMLLSKGKYYAAKLGLILLDVAEIAIDSFGKLDKLREPVKSLFNLAFDKFKKLFDFVSEIRLDIDWDGLISGRAGSIKITRGYNYDVPFREDDYFGKYGRKLVTEKNNNGQYRVYQTEDKNAFIIQGLLKPGMGMKMTREGEMSPDMRKDLWNLFVPSSEVSSNGNGQTVLTAKGLQGLKNLMQLYDIIAGISGREMLSDKMIIETLKTMNPASIGDTLRRNIIEKAQAHLGISYVPPSAALDPVWKSLYDFSAPLVSGIVEEAKSGINTGREKLGEVIISSEKPDGSREEIAKLIGQGMNVELVKATGFKFGSTIY